VQPNRRIEELRPVAIDEPRPGVWRVDMGRAFTGLTEARLRGEPGAVIRLSFAEREEQDVTYAQHSELVVGPDGEGLFRQRFNYAAGRWITIEGAAEAPRPEDLRAWLVRSDYEDAGSFRCEDPLLQQIHDTVAWTFECLSLGGYVVDCAHRERWGYGGDAHATMETALSLFDLRAFYGQWLDDWAAIQDEFGNLPFTCPTYRGGGGPAWSGIVVMLPFEVYRRSGDRRLLERCWPTIERWLAFLETVTEDGILQFYFDERYTRDVYSFLGDWVPPGGAQAGGVPDERRRFFNNAYRVWVVRTAARIAAALGRDADAARLGARADELAEAVHRRFFDPEQRVHVEARQTYFALPVLAGIGPADLQEELFARLVADLEARRHVDTGIHGTWFLVKLLLERDRVDLLHLVASQRDFPSWGQMLEQGATTIWEQWDGVNSRMHSSFLSIGAFFVEGLLGIRPLDEAPGYARFRIAPAIGVGGLNAAEGALRTVRGTIHCAWFVEGEHAGLVVVVPPGTSAELRIPTASPGTVLESGAPAEQARGLVGIRTELREDADGVARGAFQCELLSGSYRFTFAR
jgi:alpha-L-rhamnosidase